MKKEKDPAAVALGKKRWKGVSAAERSRLMKQAVSKRTKKPSPELRRAVASNASRAYWDGLTPEQRSAEMKRRAKKRKKRPT
jgi:hypothetical protein